MNDTVLCDMSLKRLMADSPTLSIPEYQRFYTWGSSHVTDLLKDITGRDRPYLLGTVILHNNTKEGKLDIVDGQQRLVTLTVLLHKLDIPNANLRLLQNASYSESAAKVIRNTQKVITGFLGGKSKEEKTVLREYLWPTEDGKDGSLLFAVLQLSGEDALDRAYTFFTSMGSKGKALSDFDLLKAHHLMFIPTAQEELAMAHNAAWQSHDEQHGKVFTQCLRRLRMWAKGCARDTQGGRPDYNEFVAVGDPRESGSGGDEHALNRYMQPAMFRSWRRDGNRIVLSMDYPARADEDMIPTEVTQTIEGGDPFFIYAKRYHALHKHLFDASDKTAIVSTAVKFVRELCASFNSGKKSTVHLHEVFQPLLLLYVDKFGEDGLIDAAVCMERIVSAKLWIARKCGLRIEGVLSYIHEQKLVPILLDATNARHVLTCLCGKLPRSGGSAEPWTNFKRIHDAYLIEFYKEHAHETRDVRIRKMALAKAGESK
jgi:hypothetical protein